MLSAGFCLEHTKSLGSDLALPLVSLSVLASRTLAVLYRATLVRRGLFLVFNDFFFVFLLSLPLPK